MVELSNLCRGSVKPIDFSGLDGRMVELRELPHSSDFNGLTHIGARLGLAEFRGFPRGVSNLREATRKETSLESVMAQIA